VVLTFYETINFLCYQIITDFAITLGHNRRNLAFQNAVKMLQNRSYSTNLLKNNKVVHLCLK